MPAIIAALWYGFLAIIGSAVAQAVVSLGVGVVAYTGVSASLDWLKVQAVEKITALPPEVVGMLSTMKVGQSISIIFSAIAVRLVIGGMTGGAMKRWVTK